MQGAVSTVASVKIEPFANWCLVLNCAHQLCGTGYKDTSLSLSAEITASIFQLQNTAPVYSSGLS